MKVPCPYCKAVLSPKKPRPGEFQPRCPGCANKFILVVPESRTGTIIVQKMIRPADATSQPAPDPAPNGRSVEE